MIILIPSYEPGPSLPTLVASLRDERPDDSIVVVDDGSGPRYRGRFDEARDAGATVLVHPVNRGKGAALKTGFEWIRDAHPGESIVCADSDGQHRSRDIARVGDELVARGSEERIVLGGRRFTGRVPARSRIGNAASRILFRLVSGIAVHDTQTGLRGYPASLIGWLTELPGERFEYEQNVLLEAARLGVAIDEIDIETVYLGHNESSHFRPVVDSLRVMRPVVGFAASSMVAFLIDLAALQVIFAVTGSLLGSVVGARLISATINFLVNRYLVFEAPERASGARHAWRYLALAVGVLTANYLALTAATAVGVPLVVAKVLVEPVLYVASFHLQRLVVFARTSRPGPRSPAEKRVTASVR